MSPPLEFAPSLRKKLIGPTHPANRMNINPDGHSTVEPEQRDHSSLGLPLRRAGTLNHYVVVLLQPIQAMLNRLYNLPVRVASFDNATGKRQRYDAAKRRINSRGC
ncbi:MAG: hypothetical protein AABN34_16735 [Acidobacteriota bacterium]